MSKNALDDLSSTKYLSHAWDDMFSASKKRKRDGFGLDGISLNNFKNNEDKFIQHLSNDLRSKQYFPQCLKPHFIPKTSGKDRVICVPSVPDRLIQRTLLTLLHDKGYGFVNEISYGFVKNRSVSMAASKAIEFREKKPWAYKADISAFFDKIDRSILIDRVRKKIRLRSLHPLIESIVNTEIIYRHKGVQKRIRKLGIKDGVGLRQGMPMSPYLANLMLLEFDKEIEARGISMVRYADDFVAFASSESECKDIHELCVGLLANEGLDLHPLNQSEKTVICNPYETIEFLGLGLAYNSCGYSLEVTKKQRDSINQKILELSDLDHCMKQGISISKLTRKLEDMISGYYGAYYGLCSNYEQLSDVMEAAKNKAMSTLFIKQFGIDYESLTSKQKCFLEIG